MVVSNGFKNWWFSSWLDGNSVNPRQKLRTWGSRKKLSRELSSLASSLAFSPAIDWQEALAKARKKKPPPDQTDETRKLTRAAGCLPRASRKPWEEEAVKVMIEICSFLICSVAELRKRRRCFLLFVMKDVLDIEIFVGLMIS